MQEEKINIELNRSMALVTTLYRLKILENMYWATIHQLHSKWPKNELC